MKYLGSTTTLDWKQNHQLQTSIKDGREGTCIVNITALNKYYSSVYINTHLLLKLTYPFICASFTYKQIENFIRSIYRPPYQ